MVFDVNGSASGEDIEHRLARIRFSAECLTLSELESGEVEEAQGARRNDLVVPRLEVSFDQTIHEDLVRIENRQHYMPESKESLAILLFKRLNYRKTNFSFIL